MWTLLNNTVRNISHPGPLAPERIYFTSMGFCADFQRDCRPPKPASQGGIGMTIFPFWRQRVLIKEFSGGPRVTKQAQKRQPENLDVLLRPLLRKDQPCQAHARVKYGKKSSIAFHSSPTKTGACVPEGRRTTAGSSSPTPTLKSTCIMQRIWW